MYLLRKKTRQNQMLRIVNPLIVIAIPAVLTYLLVTVYLNKSLLQFIPKWSDDLINWHQVATFFKVGFNGGYYTVNEQAAAAAFTHFYAHGPMYPLLFGVFANFTGWEFNTAPFLNIIILTFSIAFFILYTKPNNFQLLLIGVTLLTCWPLHLYIATNMREALFLSFSFLYIAYFYKILIEGVNVKLFDLFMCFIVIVLMTLFKVTNVVFLIPYLLLIYRRFKPSKIYFILASFILIILLGFAGTWIMAPFPNNQFSEISAAFSVSLFSGLKKFIINTALNIGQFYLHGNILFISMRAQLILIIFAGFWLKLRAHRDKTTVQESLFVLISCISSFILFIFLNDVGDWRDYRFFAPIVLTVALLFISRKRVFLSLLLLSVNFVAFPNFLETYPKNILSAFPEIEVAKSISQFSEEISGIVKYDQALDGWGNTLLISRYMLGDRRILGVPAGIGISLFSTEEFDLQKLPEIKSRYLLLDEADYQTLTERSIPLEFKRQTSLGKLYLNQKLSPS